MTFLAERTEYWARTLTAIPSVTGSADEARFADLLAGLLRASPAFSGDPGAVWKLAVPGGLHPRSCVLGLVRGGGRKTVVLTGHFDIVETGCYGDLQPLALLPDQLGPALIARIDGEPFDARSAKARDDLAGGEFLAGRGLLDMKSGLAAGLAVIEAISRDGFSGNLLFIAVPDEEGNSAGARAMSQSLAGIAADKDLDIEAAINLDATGDEGDGSIGRVVALGSVGKLLPSALVVGRASHVSDSFRGLGAAALAGALAAELEWSPDLTERTGCELGSGPTLLGMKDSKTAYDVTTPASVWMYWNVATHRRSPHDVLDTVAEAARRSSEILMAKLGERAAGSGAAVRLAEVAVLRFEELFAEVAAKTKHRRRLETAAEDLARGGADLPEQCRAITELAWELSGRSGPAIVLGFASIPYLPVTLGDDNASRRLEQAVFDASAAVAESFATTIGAIRYFPGISDVSFFGQADASHVEAIAANTPAWRSVLGGAERFGTAGLPCINAGPWGRDYHTRLERMHKDYAFRVLPALIEGIVTRILEPR